MKALKYILAIYALGFFLSCTKMSYSHSETEDSMEFSSDTESMKVKSAITEDMAFDGSKIKIFGTYTQSGNDYQVFYNTPEILTYSEGAWNYEHKQRWRRNSSYVFKAVYPIEAEPHTSSNGELVSLDYRIDSDDYDLLVASASRNPYSDAAGTGIVPLSFKHALSGIRFKIKFKNTIPAGTTDKITSLYITGVHSAGTMVFGKSDNGADSLRWITQQIIPDEKYYSWTGETQFGVEGEENAISYVLSDSKNVFFAIPQSPSEAQVHFTLERSGNTVYSAPLNIGENFSWEPGKIYTYVLGINWGNITVDISIEEWEKLTSNIDIYS